MNAERNIGKREKKHRENGDRHTIKGKMNKKKGAWEKRTKTNLGLHVIPRHEVAQGSEGGGDDVAVGVLEEVDQSAGDPRLHDGLDPVRVAVREVRQRPAGVHQYLPFHSKPVRERGQGMQAEREGMDQ